MTDSTGNRKTYVIAAVLIVGLVIAGIVATKAIRGPEVASSGKMLCNDCNIGFYAEEEAGTPCNMCGGTNTVPLRQTLPNPEQGAGTGPGGSR